MKVSAIMPTYNQVQYIGEAIKSVVNQVDELIVVDDGSTDGTWEYLDEEWTMTDRVFIHDHGLNRGSAAAINTGFDFAPARHELVTWVSSDNIHAPDWRAKLEAAFEDDVGAVYSAFLYGIGGRVCHTPYKPGNLIGSTNCFFGPSFLIRREVWEKAGGHRGKISHDYDHWLRVEEACQEMGLRIVSIPDVLCDYRVHDQRVTVTRKEQFDAPHWQQEARKRRGL